MTQKASAFGLTFCLKFYQISLRLPFESFQYIFASFFLSTARDNSSPFANTKSYMYKILGQWGSGRNLQLQSERLRVFALSQYTVLRQCEEARVSQDLQSQFKVLNQLDCTTECLLHPFSKHISVLISPTHLQAGQIAVSHFLFFSWTIPRISSHKCVSVSCSSGVSDAESTEKRNSFFPTRGTRLLY